MQQTTEGKREIEGETEVVEGRGDNAPVQDDSAILKELARIVETYPKHRYGLMECRGDGFGFLRQDRRLVVIVSVAREEDGRIWKHVSVSRRGQLPTYEDLKEVKRWFISDKETAYQVFSPADKHVNIHPYCLHLWSCLDGAVTPDFSRGSGSI